MQIDKASFFILAGTLAAGGVGGWFLRDQTRIGRSFESRLPAPAPVASPQPPPKTSASASASAQRKDSKPPCDDSVGKPLDCARIPLPTDEDICGVTGYAKLRCLQFQEAFKPKVAEEAVDCLARLHPVQVCDAVAVNKCGHEALMAACPPGPPPGATTPSTDPIERSCQSILKACHDAQPGPTLADCRQTLSGMNETGREKMVKCMEKFCNLKGLYGCEAL